MQTIRIHILKKVVGVAFLHCQTQNGALNRCSIALKEPAAGGELMFIQAAVTRVAGGKPTP
jgi:hypothetical protein